MAEGFKIADAYVEIEAELDRDRLADAISSSVSKSSGKIRSNSGKKIGNSMLDGVTDAFAAGFKPALTLGLSGITGLGTALASNPVTATIGAVLGAAIAAPMIGAIAAALTSGLGLLAGVGILGVGAILLKDNAKLKKSFESTFGSIMKTLQKAAEPLVGPFIQGLKAVEKIFKGLAPDLNAIFKAAAPLVKILTKMAGDLLGPILKGVRDAMPGITAAFEGLGAAMPAIGEAIGNFFRVVFQNKDLIRKLTKDFGEFIAWIINIAGPAINVFTVLWGAFTNIVEMGIKGWKMLFDDLGSSFDNFTEGGLARITAAWGPLKDAFMEVWDALVAFASADTDEELATTFETLVQKIKDAWGPLKTFIGTVWDEIWAFVKRVWNEKVVPWWNNTAEPWLKTKIKEGVKSAFKAAGQAIVDEVSSWPGKAMEKLKNLGTSVKNTVVGALKGAGTWLISAGESIISGLIQGIKNKINDLKGLLNGVTNLIPDWKGPMSVDRKLLFPTGQAIMGGLESGMESQLGSLQRTLGALTNAIPQMAAPAAAAPAGITVSLAGASFYGVGSADKFVAELHDALDRYDRRHR